MLILKENQRERVERSLSGQIGAAKVQQPLGSVDHPSNGRPFASLRFNYAWRDARRRRRRPNDDRSDDEMDDGRSVAP